MHYYRWSNRLINESNTLTQEIARANQRTGWA